MLASWPFSSIPCPLTALTAPSVWLLNPRTVICNIPAWCAWGSKSSSSSSLLHLPPPPFFRCVPLSPYDPIKLGLCGTIMPVFVALSSCETSWFYSLTSFIFKELAIRRICTRFCDLRKASLIKLEKPCVNPKVALKKLSLKVRRFVDLFLLVSAIGIPATLISAPNV